jgi:hypothetical protein
MPALLTVNNPRAQPGIIPQKIAGWGGGGCATLRLPPQKLAAKILQDFFGAGGLTSSGPGILGFSGSM